MQNYALGRRGFVVGLICFGAMPLVKAASPSMESSIGLRADWMRKRCGIMVHWLYPSYRDVDRWVDAFDVQAFLADFKATGADWLIFTAGQCRGAHASPNATFERLCGPGHTPRRDLVMEIARGVKEQGRRFVLYTPAEFAKDGCDDHSMQRGLCWDTAQPDRREFERRWSSVLKEWSLRLGDLCDGTDITILRVSTGLYGWRRAGRGILRRLWRSTEGRTDRKSRGVLLTISRERFQRWMSLRASPRTCCHGRMP